MDCGIGQYLFSYHPRCLFLVWLYQALLLYPYHHKQNNDMFNPKEALERIRRTKHQKQQVKNITSGVQPLFSSTETAQKPPAQIKSSNIEDRVNKLELMVMRLTDQLSTSNDVVQKLKRDNSNLQTQVLKLQYENSQLKMSQAYSGVFRSGSNKKITQPISQEPQKQKQPSIEKPKKTEKQESQNSSEKEVRDKYSIQVQQIIEDIKNEPLQNVLKRKQYQFRARKPDQKHVALGNKYLKDLAAIEKDYSKTMKKPVLVIKLDDADFQ